MKVGTDGVLLGAWAGKTIETLSRQSREDVGSVLDVGTGSGLIAMMLAQRFPMAHIDAIDIDEAAVEQARENFEHSAFSSQLSAFCSSLQDWPNHQSPITNHQYDVVVSNPPYFQNSLKNPDKARELARHTDSLSYEELITHCVRLLREDGQLALILPAETEQQVRTLAAANGLRLTHLTRVYSKAGKSAKRVLMAFEKSKNTGSGFEICEDTLVLENETGGRSAAYSELCQEFYL